MTSIEDRDFAFEEVFGNIENDFFSFSDACSYLEISETELNNLIANERLQSDNESDKEIMFLGKNLRKFRKKLVAVNL